MSNLKILFTVLFFSALGIVTAQEQITFKSEYTGVNNGIENPKDTIICLIVKPNEEEGKDAHIWSNGINSNSGASPSLIAYTWTNSGALAIKRIFLEMDLSFMSESDELMSAELSLFYNPTDAVESFDYHTGTNNIYIQRVLNSWEESTITWANQPDVTEVNQVSLPASTSETQNYEFIDVKDLIGDMLEQDNNGFMIRLVDEENVYKSVLFASSDHENELLHPEIEVCYRTVTAQSESQLNIDFEVFPNPTFGEFQIEIPEQFSKDHKIEIYNLAGKLIVPRLKMGNKIQFSEKGVFMIKLSGPNGSSKIKKIVVQ